jgi:hypothetical protein
MRRGTEGSEDAPREQLSLSPPVFICVALDDEGQPVYVVRTPEGALEVVARIAGPFKGETVTDVPPRGLPWALPRAAAVLEHYGHAADEGWAASLLAQVEAYLHGASDLGGEPAELLLSLYVLSTYVPELCDYYAEIVLEAEPERGKTRAGQAAIVASRHVIHVVGIREAKLLRDADHRQAALFIDIMRVWQSAEQRNNCTDILLGRFEKGATVERVLNPEAGPFADTTFFGVFGPTIIATSEPIHRILDTRALRIDMPLSERVFSGRLTREAAVPLVEKLMAWRALMLAGDDLAASGPPTDGRLGDVLRPLRQVLLTVDGARRRVRRHRDRPEEPAGGRPEREPGSRGRRRRVDVRSFGGRRLAPAGDRLKPLQRTDAGRQAGDVPVAGRQNTRPGLQGAAARPREQDVNPVG